MIDIAKFQKKLGVTADGILGRATLSALFQKMGASVDRGDELGLAGNVFMRDPQYGIMDTDLRLAHFMAQIAHESGGFKWMEEIASGQSYEGRVNLGNVQAGDGKRYKGRGPLQLTGRANYRRVGRIVGFDFERHPEMVAYPSVGLLVACEYWLDRRINVLADKDDIEAVTRAVNGGLNGLDDRKARYAQVRGLMT